jgi:hypothetical protein
MKKLLAPLVALALALSVATSFIVAFNAGAAHAEAVSAVVSPAPSPSMAPADRLRDPLSEPKAVVDDLKAAKRMGWGVLALAILVVVTRLLGRLGGWFAVLRKGKVSLVVASVGAFAVTAYNAIMLGGTWMAALAAGVVAVAAFLDYKPPHAKSSESSSSPSS